MHLKIYFEDKPLFLCDTIDAEIEPYMHHDDAVFIDELNAHTVKSMIHEMQKPAIHAGIFQHANLEDLKKAVWKKFTLIRAAGGVVENDKQEIMMIFRRGKWDLPKGKLDDGESLEECAVREVEEETGVKDVQLHSHLLTTYHTYHEGSKYVLKESNWYAMSVTGTQELHPQADEGIQEARWLSQQQAKKLLDKAFPLVADILNKFEEKQ